MIRAAIGVLLLLFGASSGSDPERTPSASYVLDRHKKQVARLDSKGKEVWSISFGEDVGGVQCPDLLWDERRVYISHKDVDCGW